MHSIIAIKMALYSSTTRNTKSALIQMIYIYIYGTTHTYISLRSTLHARFQTEITYNHNQFHDRALQYSSLWWHVCDMMKTKHQIKLASLTKAPLTSPLLPRYAQRLFGHFYSISVAGLKQRATYVNEGITMFIDKHCLSLDKQCLSSDKQCLSR